MTPILWEIVLWLSLGLALILVTAIWLFVVYAVVRLVAEFVRAFKATKNLDESEFK